MDILHIFKTTTNWTTMLKFKLEISGTPGMKLDQTNQFSCLPWNLIFVVHAYNTYIHIYGRSDTSMCAYVQSDYPLAFRLWKKTGVSGKRLSCLGINESADIERLSSVGIKSCNTSPLSAPYLSLHRSLFLSRPTPPSSSSPPHIFLVLHTPRSLSLFQPSGSHFLLLFSPKSRAK